MFRTRTVLLLATLVAILASARFLARRGDPWEPTDQSVETTAAAIAPAELAAAPSRARPVPKNAEPTDSAPAEAWRDIVIRDVATGEPIGDLELRSVALGKSPDGRERPSEAAPVRSSPSGFLRLPAPLRVPTPVDAARWRVVTRTAEELESTRVLWLAHTVRITGSVRAGPGAARTLDLVKVDLFAMGLGSPDARLGSLRDEGPGTGAWNHAHLLDAIRGAKIDPSTGRFELIAPRLRWLGIRARAPGWTAELIDLSDRLAGGADEIESDVVLRPTPTIRGRVLDESGRVVPGARVRLQVAVRSTLDAFNPDRTEFEGYASAVIGRPSGLVVANYACDAVVGADGTFQLDVPLDGDAGLLVHAEGRTPSRLELGRPAADETHDLTVRSATPRRVRLVDGERAVTATSVLVLDITDRDRQLPLGYVAIDRAGTMPSEWLESGREYALMFKSPVRTALLVWRDNPVLDLRELASSLTEFERRSGR